MPRLRYWTEAFVVGAAILLVPAGASAQLRGRDVTALDPANQGRGRGGAPARTPKEGAPIDLTGYWVSIVSEDWRFRMVTPPKGDFPNFLLNPEGLKLANAWDPAKDEAAADHCKAYGAPNIMRVPGRFHITWADDRTLKIDTDAGQQTRLLKFAASGAAAAPAAPPSRQGTSTAQWERKALRVDTTNLLPGYLQTNGVPFSANVKMYEYFDVINEPGGEIWLIDDSVITDLTYHVRSIKRSTHLRKQADASGWEPSPCTVR
jgi:hypothetical protein